MWVSKSQHGQRCDLNLVRWAVRASLGPSVLDMIMDGTWWGKEEEEAMIYTEAGRVGVTEWGRVPAHRAEGEELEEEPSQEGEMWSTCCRVGQEAPW